MLLQKQILPSLTNKPVVLPENNVWQLPEKVLQFGTGVLLRGLPDCFINKANNNGIFNGRIVVVQSTNKSNSEVFAKQNNLYTHCLKGIDESGTTEQYIVNAAISRVIHANNEWKEVLACAANPHLQIVMSNTTEVGIVLDEEDNLHHSPPRSFPGKLLSFLEARFNAFGGSADSGLIIIPTELIVDNGTTLKNIVCKLAHLNGLAGTFINWLQTANDWCNSLVDRIVPGALPPPDKLTLEKQYGYTDELAIISEPYGLWAIETQKERTRKALDFSKENKEVIVTNDIQKYRERKLRLLNATHTFCCGIAFISGFNLVNEAVQQAAFAGFIHPLIFTEIVPCLLQSGISCEEGEAFATAVLNRFKNPFIQHQWLSISLQYTSKIKARCLPLIATFSRPSSAVPSHMLLGFAAYLVFMKATSQQNGIFYGERNGKPYPIQDNQAAHFYNAWQHSDTEKAILQILKNQSLWTSDEIALLQPFANHIIKYATLLLAGTPLSQLLSSL